MNLKVLRRITLMLVVFIIFFTSCEKEEIIYESDNHRNKNIEQKKPNEYKEIKEENQVEIQEVIIDENKVIEVKEEVNEMIKEDESKEIEGEVNNEQQNDNKVTSNLSNEKHGWSFKRNTEHEPPIHYAKVNLEEYDGYYLLNTEEKVIYLTFDNGYENGYTSSILDTLKNNGVKATFFVTKSYIRDSTDLVNRMKEEGHIVGNHSVTHPSMPDKSDDEVIYEIEETARYMKEKTGYAMDYYFRPPRGEYSERTMYLTKQLAYKTIFWSMTYLDWDINNQPGALYAFSHVLDNHHSGAIVLLHSVSSSNAEALDDIIKAMKEEGYRFGSLDELN